MSSSRSSASGSTVESIRPLVMTFSADKPATPDGNGAKETAPSSESTVAKLTAAPVNILLVDDEPRNLDVLEGLLQSADYHLIRALTAEKALMLLLDGEFAAIVLDIQMPGMNGIELANLIKQRKRTQHIPIIFLTAYYQEDKDILEGYGIGAVDYLTKPVNPQILKSKIAVFADLFRKTRALVAINGALESEIAQRLKAEDALRSANNELEDRVRERAADLIRVNEELREREKALRESEAQAKAASRAKDDFLARLSHELRTPLNPVLLLASENATNQELPASIRTDFETIARNVTLEAKLIDDLLDLTRIAQGKLVLELRPVDLHTILYHAMSTVRTDFEQKHIGLALRLEADRCLVRADDVRLKQVLWNVLQNAVKFTPPGGRITVETSSPVGGDRLVIRITDTGIGMTSGEITRIFEAFSQGDHAAGGGSHKYGGLGLGLAISRRLVELHDGSIKASSSGRNEGTSFVIELPLLASTTGVSDTLEGARASNVSPVGSELNRALRVLLVEDHASTRHALVNLLERRKFDVLSAGSLEEAREVAGKETFDLLISDIGLPDGSGYDLMNELRGRSGLAGIALTGYGMMEDVARSEAAGFVAHLTKPVSVQSLDRALSVASARRS